MYVRMYIRLFVAFCKYFQTCVHKFTDTHAHARERNDNCHTDNYHIEVLQIVYFQVQVGIKVPVLQQACDPSRSVKVEFEKTKFKVKIKAIGRGILDDTLM